MCACVNVCVCLQFCLHIIAHNFFVFHCQHSILWFKDLSEPDTSFVLPVFAAISWLAIAEVGGGRFYNNDSNVRLWTRMTAVGFIGIMHSLPVRSIHQLFTFAFKQYFNVNWTAVCCLLLLDHVELDRSFARSCVQHPSRAPLARFAAAA